MSGNETNSKDIIDELSIGYHCKVCGIYVKNYDDPERCAHCKIPICQHCSSCSFCLNCYVNLSENARRFLKFTRVMAYTIPALFLLLFIYGIYVYVISTLISVISFILAYFIGILIIKKKSPLFFKSEWEKIIISKEYQDLIAEKSSRRYIPIDHREALEKRGIQVLQIAEEQEKILRKQSQNQKLILENQPFPGETQNTHENPSVIPYKLIGLPCPICTIPIEFADFCPNCNVRFCPKCDSQNNPYSNLCICGYIFEDIEGEFNRKFSQT